MDAEREEGIKPNHASSLAEAARPSTQSRYGGGDTGWDVLVLSSRNEEGLGVTSSTVGIESTH